VPLADDFQRIIESLPPDWSAMQFDLRINEEERYVELAPIVAEVNAWPLSKADYHWRYNVAREFGHARPLSPFTATSRSWTARASRANCS